MLVWPHRPTVREQPRAWYSARWHDDNEPETSEHRRVRDILSDRTISQYAAEIWNAVRCPIP